MDATCIILQANYTHLDDQSRCTGPLLSMLLSASVGTWHMPTFSKEDRARTWHSLQCWHWWKALRVNVKCKTQNPGQVKVTLLVNSQPWWYFHLFGNSNTDSCYSNANLNFTFYAFGSFWDTVRSVRYQNLSSLSSCMWQPTKLHRVSKKK